MPGYIRFAWTQAGAAAFPANPAFPFPPAWVTALPVPAICVSFKYFAVVVLGWILQQEVDWKLRYDYYGNYVDQMSWATQPEYFDFIVVGAGSAGAVVANRLTAPPNNFKVLLLEAGGDQNSLTFFPATDFFGYNHPGIDWMYNSVKEKYSCFSSINQEAKLHKGRTLGGSSCLNYLVYNRGNSRDFDNWARMVGDDVWRYENVLPYFMRSEDYHGWYPNPKIHGCGGNLNVEKPGFFKGQEYLLAALEENGLKNGDVNDNQTNTWSMMEQTSKSGVRWSTYLAFLWPILDRPNFILRKYSFVTKLLFDPEDPKSVIGVEYLWHNTTLHKAYASKEVILSSGSYNSPKILMLSGIGPPKQLKKFGIPIRLELPVGKHLEDHPTSLLPFLFDKPGTSLLFERDALWDFTGALTQPHKLGDLGGNNLLSIGYISTPVFNDPLWPDMQFHISYLGMTTLLPEFLTPIFNTEHAPLEAYFNPVNGRDGNLVIITGVRTRSLGYVQLRSANPLDPPLIRNNFFQHNDDLQAMVHAMKWLVDFYEKSPSYNRIGAKFMPYGWPDCNSTEFRSGKYYECHARHLTFSLWHPVGTCRMGKLGDNRTVTDSRLRVKGIKNLRVIDGSIMPKVTNGNTNAPIIMIGERGADFILEDWGGVKAPVGSQKQCEGHMDQLDFGPLNNIVNTVAG